MTLTLMLPAESTHLFSFACLQQLSQELTASDFVPSIAQKVILNQALRLLDLELSFRAAEYPELMARIEQELSSDC